MYLVLFTYAFGGAIAGGTHKYLQLSLPGILVLSVVFAPVTYLTEAERGLLTGGPVAAPAIRTLLWALAIFVVFALLAVRAYRRRT